MPEGSSSAAPVIMPGPNDFNSARTQEEGTDGDPRDLGVRFAGVKARIGIQLPASWFQICARRSQVAAMNRPTFSLPPASTLASC